MPQASAPNTAHVKLMINDTLNLPKNGYKAMEIKFVGEPT